MTDNSIYKDVAARTGGDIYIGVVGPVRTGKSTFIHRFLESAVLPNIKDENDRARTVDQLPQSASGRTVMTTEPKFVPDEAVSITLGDGAKMRVKMVDCVGYMVDGALGAEEDGSERMVKTPWSKKAMPFSEAAELGTSKVIGEHSTIAMLVTTDGTISDIPRESYVSAEERVVRELREHGKPFAIVLNSKDPSTATARSLADELEKKYSAPVALVSCPELDSEDVYGILSLVLSEFPVTSLTFELPEWTEALPREHALCTGILSEVRAFADEVERLGDIERALPSHPRFKLASANAADGTASLCVPLERELLYETMSETVGLEISNDKELFTTVSALARTKREYEKIAAALADAESNGYGIVLPKREELIIDEPRVVKSAGGYGVRIAARAESLHLIKTEVRAELNPVIGSEEQAGEVAKFLGDEYTESPDRVLGYNMLGRSVYDMVSDAMQAKLTNLPPDSREKLGETLGKIVNDGAKGLICILL